MNTWKQDRIFSWLCSGYGQNTDNYTIYLIDKKDKICFNVIKKNETFKRRKRQIRRSWSERRKLNILISRFLNNDSEILQLPKTGKYAKYLNKPEGSKRTKEEYDLGMQKGIEMANEIKLFLSEQKIEIEEYDLLA